MTDKERLDWMEKRIRASYDGESEVSFGIADSDWPDCVKGESIVMTHSFADESIGATLRQTIDKAMERGE